MRAALEEGRIFPQHDFYPGDQGTGPDPRFGTLHAAYAALGSLAGLSPLRSWHLATVLGLLSILGGAWQLSLVLLRNERLRWLAILLVFATYGGSVYNPFRVAGYPLWFALGPLLGGMALWWQPRSGEAQRGLAALLLATLPALHALAGVFAAILLGLAALAHGRGALSVLRRSMSIWLALGVCFGIRFAIAYGDVNPIHQRPWEVVLVPGVGFAARPTYIWGWLGPVGSMALLVLVGRWQAWWADPMRRWLMLSSLLSLLLMLPPLLSALLPLLGFLPLRFVMLLFFPWILVLWLGEGHWRSRSVTVWLLLVAAGAAWRLTERWELTEGNATLSGPEFARVRAELERAASGAMPVVLSDPFTMLALRATAPCAIVAVPDGRSSPRDAQAIQRLRDSWRALACASSEGELVDAVQRYGVTHVVWNGSFRSDLRGYEYPVHRNSLTAQRARLAAMRPWLRPIIVGEEMSLYGVENLATPPQTSATCVCTESAPALQERVLLRDGYWLSNARVEVSTDSENVRWLDVDGLLGAQRGELADRRLTVRLDRVESTRPQLLQKPLRKWRERVSGLRQRVRYDVLPRNGMCPTWTLESGGVIPLDLRLRVPQDVSPGEYRVTIQAVDWSVFAALRLRDFFLDNDYYSGPELGRVQLIEWPR